MDRNAIVIGSGVAGLASAIRLAAQGFKVRVFEKNNYPGGKLSHFEQNGYQFDAGPSLFTQPFHIEELFALAGEPMEDYFSYRQVPVSCHYFFSNGKKIKAWADRQKFAKEMANELGEDEGKIDQYLNRSKNLFRHVGNLFLQHSLHKIKDFSFSEIWKALKTVKGAYLFQSLHSYNRGFFKTAEATQLFNRYATYNGSNPYKAPAMLSLIPHLEMNEGTFYPDGGMISITTALYRLCLKLGVTFQFETPVDRILTADGVVTGVESGGHTYLASLVVSNQDVYFTYKNLLKLPLKAKQVLKQERSSSALIFYWGIGKDFPDLGLHNIFFSNDYQQEFEHIFEKGTLFHDPTIYINITSKMEPGMAPEGKENWFVMVNVPANQGQHWEDLQKQTKERVIQKLNKVFNVQLESFIETEAILDPVTIESKTMSYMGSLYGTSSNSKLAAFLRHPNFSRQFKGLYFVGGSVHPGGGIPLCLRSAAILGDMVKKDF